jgi:hypothetical protein
MDFQKPAQQSPPTAAASGGILNRIGFIKELFPKTEVFGKPPN